MILTPSFGIVLIKSHWHQVIMAVLYPDHL